jgi:biopolymer transport protein ExbD
MRLRATETDEEAGVMMAPLIDCVFILMIYFLTTSLLQKQHRDRGIVLPEAKSPVETTAPYDMVIIEITAPKPPRNHGMVVVNGEEVTLMLLHRRLRELTIAKQDRRVRLDVDRDADVQDVCQMLDLLQFEGLTDVGVRTRD